MKLVAALTLWILFSIWLLFPYLGVPRMLITAAATLGSLEFLTVLTWGFASEDCIQRPCSPVSEAARTAAGIDLPVLSVVVIGLAVAYGLRKRRRATLRA